MAYNCTSIYCRTGSKTRTMREKAKAVPKTLSTFIHKVI